MVVVVEEILIKKVKEEKGLKMLLTSHAAMLHVFFFVRRTRKTKHFVGYNGYGHYFIKCFFVVLLIL